MTTLPIFVHLGKTRMADTENRFFNKNFQLLTGDLCQKPFVLFILVYPFGTWAVSKICDTFTQIRG